MRLRAALPSFTTMGVVWEVVRLLECQGPSPPLVVALMVRSPERTAGLLVSNWSWTLPSAPVVGSRLPVVTNSYPATRSEGSRISMTAGARRSEEHTSELQSRVDISY